MCSKQNRSAWKCILASTVMALSVAPTCAAQQRGQLIEAILDRYDTDGDGKLSPAERSAIKRRPFARNQQQNAEVKIPADLKSLYKMATGQHPIDSIATLTLNSADRPEPLQVRLTYPTSSGKFPVIVFSHGAFGSKDAYLPIVEYWASHGYVVIQATHGDSLSLLSARERLELLRLPNALEAADIDKHWKSRADDVRLILSSLDKIQTLHKPVAGKLNTKQIGVGGHSYGCQTMQLISGLDLGIDLHYPGIDAMLLLSPPAPEREATATNYQRITVPVLAVTGTKDNTRHRKTFQARVETYNRIPSKHKHLLFIKDGEHNLGGVSGVAGRLVGGGWNATHLSYVKSSSVAFWDAYLKDDEAAHEILRSNAIGATTAEDATVTQGDSPLAKR